MKAFPCGFAVAGWGGTLKRVSTYDSENIAETMSPITFRDFSRSIFCGKTGGNRDLNDRI